MDLIPAMMLWLKKKKKESYIESGTATDAMQLFYIFKGSWLFNGGWM